MSVLEDLRNIRKLSGEKLGADQGREIKVYPNRRAPREIREYANPMVNTPDLMQYMRELEMHKGMFSDERD
jgi:hypothetical protein